MEFVQAALTSIQLLTNFSYSCIRECVNYKEILDEKKRILERKLKELGSLEDDVNTELKSAMCYSDGKKQTKKEVETWLDNVRDKTGEVGDILQKAGRRRSFSRSRFLRLVEKNIKEIEELIEKGKFPEGTFIDVHQDKNLALIKPALVGQSVKDRKLTEIWGYLMNDEITSIGIWGMGGIGKTTIAIHIQNQLLESTGTVDHVYWVTVSQQSSFHKLQEEIAKVVDLDFSGEQDERKRAAMLFEELTKRKKFVLILDDLWKDFPVERVGIPIRVDIGKLMLTTRSVDVCRKMSCQKISKVEPLLTTEAWDLFMGTLKRERALAPEVEEIAKSIVEECAGLPLAIITTAGSMKGVDDIHEWRNALNELTDPTKGSSDIEDEVFKILRFSYDRLNDEKVQESFLYCALFPEDYEIPREDLIVYLIAEGLVDEMENREAEFDRGHTLLNKLENACLLEHTKDYSGDGCVKMHDVIRDMALKMTRENSRFMVKAGVKLIEFPNEREWSENLERVSIMYTGVEEDLPFMSPKCPKLCTLLLQSNRIKKIPNCFFVHMQNLKVLDLSGKMLVRMPESISDLENLRALLLKSCSCLEYLPSVAKLTELRELDLGGTSIKELPHGMEKLVNLKRFDISFAVYNHQQQLLAFPSGVLANLSHLQSLRGNSFKIIDDVDVKAISSLRRLKVLYICFKNLQIFNSYVKSQHWQSLTHYSLQINKCLGFQTLNDTRSRALTIENCGDFIGGGENLLLPTNIQELNIHSCDNLTNVSYISSLKSTRKLKRCSIWYGMGIKHLFWPLSVSLEEYDLFQSLEELTIGKLGNLIFLFNLNATGAGAGVGVEGAPPKCGSFSNLKLVSIYECPELKYVFTQGLVQHYLQNLEHIRVDLCYEMENIIVADEEEKQGEIVSAKEEEIACPRLQRLTLGSLPKCKSIWKGTLVCNSLQEIQVWECPNLKRLPLSPHYSQTSSTLKKIKGEELWWDRLEWDHSDAKSAFQPLYEIGENPVWKQKPWWMGRRVGKYEKYS